MTPPDGADPRPTSRSTQDSEHRRRRLRRRGRTVYIRSVHFLPSLATLGNAICGFAAIYIAGLNMERSPANPDPWAAALAPHQYTAAAYFIFFAMFFDAIDGRLARFTRHTTDFGGQLDSLADVISFGVAPAYLALQVFKFDGPQIPFVISRFIWAIGALYVCCAAIRLARFNVANEHGEQHHFSFLGLPSPGAGAVVAAFVLMQQDLKFEGIEHQRSFLELLSNICLYILPLVLLAAGLLMVSGIRYPHLVNRYLRGQQALGRLITAVVIVLLLVVAHQYVLGVGALLYMLTGVVPYAYVRLKSRFASTSD